MQIKEFEALTLKECLQQVKDEMGPDAVILETRKFRKGGLMGVGAHDAVAIVAATGITIDGEPPAASGMPVLQVSTPIGSSRSTAVAAPPAPIEKPAATPPTRTAAAARMAARGVYGARATVRDEKIEPAAATEMDNGAAAFAALLTAGGVVSRERVRRPDVSQAPKRPSGPVDCASDVPSLPPARKGSETPATAPMQAEDSLRFAYLERAMGEIRECLIALQREQRDSHDRTVSAVVSAVAPAVSAVSAAGFAACSEHLQPRFPALQDRMRQVGVSETLVQDLFDQLPDMGAWSEQAQEALALSALKDLITRRVPTSGPIALTPGRPKIVALIGPTGVGKTTTIAKLAADFALMQGKKVALLTVDTYRIAAVEQLKTYSQIIGLPVSVAYNHSEVPAVLQQYANYDLILIDTAGRSQQHSTQIGELKSLLDVVECETHLVLSAPTKEQDMLDAARRFAAARVDRLIFSKLDETASYGTLLNVVDQTGIPLSYLTTGQKVPEDLETADGARMAEMILGLGMMA